MTSVVEYERWLVERDDAILEQIRRYNEDDVRSTHDLHAWLEERRAELAREHDLSRGHCRPSSRRSARRSVAETALAEELAEAGHELLAGCVGWHRREARPGWWEYFRYETLDTAELVEDATAIGALGEPVHVDDVLSDTAA